MKPQRAMHFVAKSMDKKFQNTIFEKMILKKTMPVKTMFEMVVELNLK
jgi:hypothetical protein